MKRENGTGIWAKSRLQIWDLGKIWAGKWGSQLPVMTLNIHTSKRCQTDTHAGDDVSPVSHN